MLQLEHTALILFSFWNESTLTNQGSYARNKERCGITKWSWLTILYLLLKDITI
jgi:hypothetical protein